MIKIVKDDIKSVLKVLGPLYMGLTLFAGFIALIFRDEDYGYFRTLVEVLEGLLYICVIGVIIICALFMICRNFNKIFVRNQDDAEDTVSLKLYKIIIAKLLSGMLLLSISSAAAITACFLFGYKSYESFDENLMIRILKMHLDGIGITLVMLKMKMLISLMLLTARLILEVYACICVGNLFSSKQRIIAVEVFILIEVIEPSLSVLFGLVSNLYIVDNQVNLFTGKAINYRSIIYIIECVIYYIVSKRILSKKLSLK